VSLLRLRHALRTRIWLVPLLIPLLMLGFAVLTLAIDRANDYELVGQSLIGSPTSVQQLLSTAASSVLSLATVVVSLMLVVVSPAPDRHRWPAPSVPRSRTSGPLRRPTAAPPWTASSSC